MHFLALLSLAAIPLAAGQRVLKGTIYTENEFTGKYLNIRSENCIKLRGVFEGNVNSILVEHNQLCVLYRDERCQGDSAVGFYENDTPYINNPRVKSVKCEDSGSGEAE